jgi:hypothetical protein
LPTISMATYSTPYTRNETLMAGGSSDRAACWSLSGAGRPPRHPFG